MDLLTYAIIVILVYFVIAILIRVYLVQWLEPLQHERYNGRDVYAVDSHGTLWHVQRPLLTLYKDIKDPSISSPTGQPPSNHREIKLWTFTLALPGVLSPVIRAFLGK
jgi:hypothetical protein